MSNEIFIKEGWRITSPYGPRIHPVTRSSSNHRGVDMVKVHQFPIPAFVGGEVIFAGMGQTGTGFGNYGNVVAIKDDAGYLHVYAHLDSVAAKKGQQINEGHIVGRQGSTGMSTGSHLHYEVRQKSSPSFGYGTEVNPGLYLVKYIQNKQASVSLTINGRQTKVPLRIVDGRTEALLSGAWVQLRDLAGLLGAGIDWDERTKTVNFSID